MLENPNNEPRSIPWTFRRTIWGTLPYGLVTSLAYLPLPQAQPTVNTFGVRIIGTVIAFIISFTILLAPVYIIAIRKRKAALNDLGFCSFSTSQTLPSALLIALGYVAAAYLWVFMGGRREPLPYFGTGLGAFFLSLIFVAGLTPIVEELFFRGFLYIGLRNRLHFWPAAILSAALFGLGHNAIYPQAALGVALPWLRERTGSLWPCVLVHSAVNLTIVTIRYLTHRFPA